MIQTPQTTHSRSSAHPLKRFAQALKRTPRFSETRFSLARAHPPIPPRGGRLSAARASLERARSSARARIDRLGTPGQIWGGDASGNSTQYRQTFFRLSCPVARIARVADLPRLAPPTRMYCPLATRPNEARRRGGKRTTPTHQSRATVGLDSHHMHGGIRHESCPEEHR